MTTIKFVYVYKIHTMKVTYTNKHKTNEQKKLYDENKKRRDNYINLNVFEVNKILLQNVK